MTAEITFTEDTLRYINLFEQVTRTRVKDCMEAGDKLVFVVEPGQANRAVGKGGENVIRLNKQTGKNIQVVEYSDDPEKFIRNVFYNYKVQKVVIEDRGNIVHATVTVDPQVKGRAIGKNGRNLKIARDIVNRHHNVQSINVA
ncbi:MAG: NusA-like transcription termination signal-binding factor [Euryarchaeota archaeon]|nr:NusA-like transcription termination signal-binding factor [Euryarchaeota archaeon]